MQSRALLGLEAAAVTVEVHLANGLPSFTLVGLAETEVKEARERVRSAIQNAGLEFPTNKKIVVNLAPADLPKDSGYRLGCSMDIAWCMVYFMDARCEGLRQGSISTKFLSPICLATVESTGQVFAGQGIAECPCPRRWPHEKPH
ncbi:hypothetical protein GmRootV118_53900 [Variovorax sp. V118]